MQPNPFLHNVYALASYRKTVGVYLEPRAHLLCLLEGQAGGVTHAQFTADGSKLLVGGRKDPEVLIWDMRNPGRLFAVLRRPVDTNQRVYFDVHPENCRWVSERRIANSSARQNAKFQEKTRLHSNGQI